jgi:putative addiction module component (TIGR02574 family)
MSDPAKDLHSMTSEEKLRLLEELWEELSQNPDSIPLTKAQQEELDRRINELDSGDTRGIPWDDVLARLRGNRES